MTTVFPQLGDQWVDQDGRIVQVEAIGLWTPAVMFRYDEPPDSGEWMACDEFQDRFSFYSDDPVDHAAIWLDRVEPSAWGRDAVSKLRGER